MNGANALIPSATIGASVASVTINAASMMPRMSGTATLFISVLLLFVMFS